MRQTCTHACYYHVRVLFIAHEGFYLFAGANQGLYYYLDVAHGQSLMCVMCKLAVDKRHNPQALHFVTKVNSWCCSCALLFKTLG